MNKFRFHCLQHVNYENPGFLKEWIENKNQILTCTNFFNGDNLPLHEDYDVLIIMGGPMGVYDENLYPWLKQEKKFIGESIAKNKKVIGICLGSQLLANVLGSKVYPNLEKEIGFFPVFKKSYNFIMSGFPESAIAFHWHSDTFDLPKGSLLLASSDICQNQAFSYNSNVLGLQFHLEITESLIQGLIKNNKHELIKKPFIQT